MAHPDAPRPRSTSSELVPLARLTSVRMAEGEPDVRGWPVVAADGAPVGRVAELLVDPAVSEIAAVLVALPHAADVQADRAVLPMERVRIDERGRRLVADARDLAPAARPRDAAESAVDPTRVTTGRDANGDEVIRVPVVEERLVVEKRPVVTEMLVIRKRAVPEDHVVEADLRRERVDVEQRDADGRVRPERPERPER